MVFKKITCAQTKMTCGLILFIQPLLFFISNILIKKNVSTSSHNETFKIVIHTHYVVKKRMAYVKPFFFLSLEVKIHFFKHRSSELFLIS